MLSRRKRRCFIYVVLAVLAGMLPMTALMWLSHHRAMQRSEESLQRLVNAGVKRFENVISTAEQVLTRLAETTGGRMTDDTAELLRRTAYNSPYFREVGLVDSEGNLVCTSLGPTVPPIAVPPSQLLNYANRTVQIAGLVRTQLMKESSIVISLPTGGRGEVNVLVNPSVLTELFDLFPLGPDGYVVFVLPSGEVLASYGTITINSSYHSRNAHSEDIRASTVTSKCGVSR